MDSFCAQVAEGEFGANETPESLGLYGGRLTIVFYPGEFVANCVGVFVCV